MTTMRSLVETSPAFAVSTPVQGSISTTAAVALAENQKRKGFMLQNTGTTTLKGTYGTTDPTQTVYHFALSACTVANDGKGGVLVENAWVGAVRIISDAVSGTYVVTEFTTGSPDWNQARDWGVR